MLLMIIDYLVLSMRLITHNILYTILLAQGFNEGITPRQIINAVVHYLNCD